MRPKLNPDLDEVGLGLLDIISYVRRFGVSNGELQRLLNERLQTAFEIADEFDDCLAELITSPTPTIN